jgi:hypothetical protein
VFVFLFLSSTIIDTKQSFFMNTKTFLHSSMTSSLLLLILLPTTMSSTAHRRRHDPDPGGTLVELDKGIDISSSCGGSFEPNLRYVAIILIMTYLVADHTAAVDFISLPFLLRGGK